MAKFTPTQMPESDYQYAVDNDEGFCTSCKDFTRDCCEPDACNYPCPECEQRTVYGAEEALMMGLIEFSDE